MNEATLPITSANGSSFAVVLGLPERSSVSLDGQTIMLHRNDFVGIGGIPLDGFHLMAIRPCVRTKQSPGQFTPNSNNNNNNNNNNSEPVFASVTTGFVISSSVTGHGPMMRKYDPQTEEVSNGPLDETTRDNLMHAIEQQNMDPQRLLPYASVLRTEAAAMAWRDFTGMVTYELLISRGIPPGTKIVPGSHDEEMSNFTNTTLQDGCSPSYPNIPVLDDEKNGSYTQRQQEQHHRRASAHRGTKAFLQALSPSQRTSLLLEKDPCTVSFRMVLNDTYRGNWTLLLGDIQLAFVLFLNLHCYSSLEHWRDMVALCCRVSASTLYEYSDLFTSLIKVLSSQIQNMEGDFFDDVELSGDNFLVPSLQRLLRTLISTQDPTLMRAAHDFSKRLSDQLPHHFPNPTSEETTTTTSEVAAKQKMDNVSDRMIIEVDSMDEKDEESGPEEGEDDLDGPVVVALEEVEASYERQKSADLHIGRTPGVPVTYDREIMTRFPILFAAQQPHEDIVMTCARALDAATDVSLVREAADYLEQVEAKKNNPLLPTAT